MERLHPLRRVPVIVLAVLLLASVPAAPAASGALEADAGFSVVAYNGEATPVSGRAFGGVAPYAYAWSHAGSDARFASPASADTTFDTAGLPDGPVTLTLQVTDAAGDVATDTVKLLVGQAPLLKDEDVTVVGGVPDEALTGAGSSRDGKGVLFTVPAGTARIEATLSWPDDGYTDLDLDLRGPQGASSGQQGWTAENPERVTVHAPPAGTWQAIVKPFLSTGTTARLTIQAFPAGALPAAVGVPGRPYGVLDAQEVHASAQRGTAPYAFAWDLDGDGRFETPGATAAVSRGPGQHLVAFKVTDAAGFEAKGLAPLDVRDADHALRYGCGPAPGALGAMEFAGSGGTCWVHGGHHTYFLGGKTAKLRGVTGVAFAVEQQFSPSAPQPSDPTAWPLHVEVSEDALSWTEVGTGRYLVTSSRQYVGFELSDLDEDFRFVRFRAPLSAAQGLSGYMDHTEGWLLVDALRDVTAPAPEPGARVLACEADLVEDFFADTHPCWFGGIDRYDAPSFWHTYFLGDGATLDNVTGSLTLAPWRSDDWFNNNTVANATRTYATLLTSMDGVEWTERARIDATYGVPAPFHVELGGVEARFVQLFPEPHADFENVGSEAPNHHPRGYFVDSRMVATGLVIHD